MSRNFFKTLVLGEIFAGNELGNLKDPGGGVCDAI
jgi:hypothetical protein